MDKKIAHISDDKREQTVREHLIGTARLAEENAVEMFKPIARALGMAHDIGKYSDAFQARIRGSNVRFEHSACGAIEYREIYSSEQSVLINLAAPMMEFCIACHHTGLQNGGSLALADAPNLEGTMNSRISKSRKERDYSGKSDYGSYKDEIILEKPDFSKVLECFKEAKSRVDILELFAFFTRYLFSCLTDADYIDTERFCSPGKERGYSSDFKTPLARLEKRLSEFTSDTAVRCARSRVQAQAFQNAKNGAQISILNMPTGSGKTLCSLKIALEKINSDKSKKRLIYVIPYTGIIDQTANEFAPIFNDCCVLLQHHSNYSYKESGEDDLTAEKLRRSCENWDAPVIITTAVQFFESVCHYKSSALRKLHNMADSIIVFDEIHTLPVELLQPCLRSIGAITKYLNSEAIFLSATMPDYSRLFEKYAPGCRISHLITDRSDFKAFKTAEFKNMGRVETETVIMKAAEYQSCLIVVNSRKTARMFYGMISGNKYHLSTYMTPRDRKVVIKKVKTDISEGRVVTVVSTSLIEAGIDLDFETVFREINGLDNILQAGGRCNREGKRERGEVFVFETSDSCASLSKRANETKRLLEKYGDISSTECIEEYYNEIFDFNGDLIAENTIAADCKLPAELPFRDYAERIRLIDEESVGVVIPQDEHCRTLLGHLKNGDRTVLRALQQYMVALKLGGSNEFGHALESGVISEDSGVYVITRSEYYDPEIGLDIYASVDVFL